MDSIIALFRTDYCGRGELADRQQKLGIMMAKLMKLVCDRTNPFWYHANEASPQAEEFNVAVFITNQMCSDPGAGMVNCGHFGTFVMWCLTLYLFLS